MPETTKNPAATAAIRKKKQDAEVTELAKRIEKKETKARIEEPEKRDRINMQNWNNWKMQQAKIFRTKSASYVH